MEAGTLAAVSRMIFMGFALSVAAGVRADDKCLARGNMGDKPFSMAHCAISYYDGQHSVTIWFSQAPIPPAETKSFQISSYASPRDANGKSRTQMHLGFCPGGGGAVARPEAVKSVEIGLDSGDSPMLSRQWVLDPTQDKHIRFEKLSGDLKPGGRLAGRVTGGKTKDEDTQAAYSWQIEFDLRLPENAAASGMGCE